MASSVRRLCLDATLGRYWRIGLVVRRVWIVRMDRRFGGISRIAEARETDFPRSSSSSFRPTPCSPLPAIVIVRLMLAWAPMTFSRQPGLLRSTLHRPALARSHSLKALSSFRLSSRAC